MLSMFSNLSRRASRRESAYSDFDAGGSQEQGFDTMANAGDDRDQQPAEQQLAEQAAGGDAEVHVVRSQSLSLVDTAAREDSTQEGRRALASSKRSSWGSVFKPTRLAAPRAAKEKVAFEAVHRAAWRGDAAEVQRLLALGAKANTRDKSGLAPIHYAAWQGHATVLKALLAAGVRVNTPDAEGLLPLHYAAWMNQAEAAALLLDCGSALNPEDDEATTRRAWTITPLIFAAKMGHLDMCSLLLARGATLDGPVQGSGSALHEAAWCGQAAVVSLMMRTNGHHDRVTPKNHYRPLHMAAMAGHASVVEALAAHHAWLDSRSKSGRTPLHFACLYGHFEAAKALVRAGADLEARDKEGFAPLHLAVDQHHLELAAMLLQAGADHTARAVTGAQAVNYAHDRDLKKLLLALRWYGTPAAGFGAVGRAGTGAAHMKGVKAAAQQGAAESALWRAPSLETSAAEADAPLPQLAESPTPHAASAAAGSMVPQMRGGAVPPATPANSFNDAGTAAAAAAAATGDKSMVGAPAASMNDEQLMRKIKEALGMDEDAPLDVAAPEEGEAALADFLRMPASISIDARPQQNDAVLLSSCEDDVQSGGSSPAPAGPGMVLTTPQRSRLGAKASRIPTRESKEGVLAASAAGSADQSMLRASGEKAAGSKAQPVKTQGTHAGCAVRKCDACAAAKAPKSPTKPAAKPAAHAGVRTSAR